jgi:hypothetical protein
VIFLDRQARYDNQMDRKINRECIEFWLVFIKCPA